MIESSFTLVSRASSLFLSLFSFSLAWSSSLRHFTPFLHFPRRSHIHAPLSLYLFSSVHLGSYPGCNHRRVAGLGWVLADTGNPGKSCILAASTRSPQRPSQTYKGENLVAGNFDGL